MQLGYKRKEPFEGKRFPLFMVTLKNSSVLVRPHWHEHLEFIKVLDGAVLIEIDGEQLEGRQGDLFFVNSGQIHAIRAMPGSVGIIQGLVFDKILLLQSLDSMELQRLYSLFIGFNRIANRYGRSDPIWCELDEGMTKAYDEYKSQDIGYEYVILSCVYRMIAALLRLHRGQLLTGQNDAYAVHYTRLKASLDYFEDHYAEPIYMEEVSRICSMSLYHFTRLFKLVFGLTPIQHLTHVRINRSKRLLLDKDLPIADIAERAGFGNVTYFDRVFKKKTGCTPLQFRKRFDSSE